MTNHGVELLDGKEALLERVLELCDMYYKSVPVLVICSSATELTAVHEAVQKRGKMPSDEVQRLSEFDAKGASLKSDWQTIIDDATKRLGGVDDNRCRVTVTDRFGGRYAPRETTPIHPPPACSHRPACAFASRVLSQRP